MKKYYTRPKICPLFLIFFFVNSCNAQVKTQAPADIISNQTSTSIAQPKLIKKQVIDQYQTAADNVHCGLQDKAGNLWFGTTNDGVYRYDGKSFTNFTMKDGLDTNQILSILEDKLGNIWFGTRNGICCYNGKTIAKIPIAANNQYSFSRSVSSYHNPTAQNAVWSIMQDKNGTLWFGTDDGVYCLNRKVFTRFLDDSKVINPGGLTLKSVQYMLEDTKGNIWFGSGPMAFEGICFYDGKTLTNSKPKRQEWIRKIVETHNGRILFATRSGGIFFYDSFGEQTGVKSFDSFPMPPAFFTGSLTNIFEDKEGVIWMASDYGNNHGDHNGGLWRSNLSDDKMAEKTFTKITDKEVFFMLEDTDNNIWFGTRGTGLYRYDRKTLTCFSEEQK